MLDVMLYCSVSKFMSHLTDYNVKNNMKIGPQIRKFVVSERNKYQLCYFVNCRPHLEARHTEIYTLPVKLS